MNAALRCIMFLAASGVMAQAPATNPATGLPKDVAMPIKVHVVVNYVAIPRVADMAKTFDATVSVELRWRDPRLAFDIKAEGTDRRDFGPDTAPARLAGMWQPGAEVTNMRETDSRIEHGLSISADGWVRHVQRIRATFDAPIQLNKFPFDTQTLPIRIALPLYNVNQVVLIQDQSDIDASQIGRGVDMSGWEVRRLEFALSRPRNWSGGYNSEMEARLVGSRKSLYPLTVILTPFFLLLVVPTVYALYITVETSHTFNSWSGSILALIALSFTFSIRFPNGPDGVVMQLVNTGFLYQLLMIFVLVLNRKLTPKYPAVMKEAMGFLRWAAPLGLLATVFARIGLIAYS
jgi:hypothetical protein